LPEQKYEILVEGLLSESWMSWFEGLTICHLTSKQSLLSGSMDQAMLRGILNKISDLGLDLISLQRSTCNNSVPRKEEA